MATNPKGESAQSTHDYRQAVQSMDSISQDGQTPWREISRKLGADRSGFLYRLREYKAGRRWSKAAQE